MIRPLRTDPGNTLLLDTHIWVWMVANTLQDISGAARTALENAAARRSLKVSAVSVWEVGVLSQKKRLGLTMHVTAWVEQGLAAPGVQQVSLDAATALLSTTLPDEPPHDPADRFLLAKAYRYGWTLVTSDARIVQYAGAQNIAVLDARS